jgi:hypothetical protein
MPSGKKHTFLGRTVEDKPIFYIPTAPSAVGSLFFNDANQFLQFPRDGVINLTDGASPFTIEAWIKPTSIRTIAAPGLDVNGNPTSDYGDIIIGDTAGGGNNWSLQLFNNKLTFYTYNGPLGGLKFFTSNSQIPLNEWTHVAVSYNALESILSIFINGVSDATFGDYYPPEIQYSVITIGNLFDSGSTPWASGAYAYKGYITNLRINDNQFFYEYLSPFEPTAPLGYISGTTLILLANQNEPTKDSSPGNVTITNVGSVTYSSQYPTVADCANNDAKVLMIGWFIGPVSLPRPLTRDNENLYTYYANGNPGDETLSRANTSSPWIYANLGTPLATSLTVSQFPWQAAWPSPFTATKACAAFINQIIISNGTYIPANSTYTKNPSNNNFTRADGLGSIFFGGDAWYIFSADIGNVAVNYLNLDVNSWQAWAPGNSSNIIAVNT